MSECITIYNKRYTDVPDKPQVSSTKLQIAIEKLAKDIVNKYVTDGLIIGLGSGSTATMIVKEMANSPFKKNLNVICTSLQIKIQAEKSGLNILDESKVPEIDIVFDGADQIDSNYNMIKGGGGALFREKILIAASKRFVIAADSSKFVQQLDKPIPIEVHPFARKWVETKIKQMGGEPVLRSLEKGYPIITENGNIILDTEFESISSTNNKNSRFKAMETEIKNISGVVEVGLFTRIAERYYKANQDGTFEVLEHEKQ